LVIWGQLFSEIHRVGLGNIRVLVRFNTSLCRVPVFRKSQCRPRVASHTEYNQSQAYVSGPPIYWKLAIGFGFGGPAPWFNHLAIKERIFNFRKVSCM